MTQILALLVILAIIIGIIKVGSFLWRVVGLAFAVFLLWIFKDDILQWGQSLMEGDGLANLFQQAGDFITEGFHQVSGWLQELFA